MGSSINIVSTPFTTKLLLMSVGAMSLAATVWLKQLFAGPISTNDAEGIKNPTIVWTTIWSVIVPWLKPPYLYITIHFIIITIGISSRFSSSRDDRRRPPTSSIDSYNIKAEADSFEPLDRRHESPVDEEEATVVVEESGGTVDHVKDDDEIIYLVNESADYDDEEEERGGDAKDVDEYKVVEAAEILPENSHGFEETGLRCNNDDESKHLQTLESTWKMITDQSRCLAMARSHVYGSRNGSTEIQKELSSGQEELNRRVEEFIKKINRDLRMERERSLNQHIQTY